MRNKFWKNKKVLITGYEGFLGSWLTKKLLSYKANIVGLDILTRRKKTILNKNDFNKIKIINGSIENYKLVSNVIKGNNIDTIFHLAAQSIVTEANLNPLTTFKSNIEGTWNVLEASRNNKSVKRIIVTSSDKAYGEHKKLPYFEDSPLKGTHPYDVSKSCMDLLAYTYFHTYNLGVCILRCGNIYGEGDFHFTRIVPDTIYSLLKNRRLLIRSDGKFIRDYIYIEDVVRGCVTLAEKINSLKLWGQAFNLSNEVPISVLELVKKISNLLKRKPNVKILNKAEYEIRKQYLSSKKAKKILDWKPRYTLEEGLKKTITWYKKFFQGSK